MKTLALTFSTLLFAGCTALPHGVFPVENFELERYLGTWYEIARLDHSFERGLSKVSATYNKRSDGGIDILNRGMDRKTGTWKEAKGRAYFLGEPEVARLKVTFFWPFYGGYNVIDLDHKNYSYALVCGPSKKYLWILARTKKLDEAIMGELVNKARELDFDVSTLIVVEQ